MQSQNENGNQPPAADPNSAPRPELSEAWRALLGLQSTPAPESEQPLDSSSEVQLQASDPWNTLVHTQGMESVDLQKIRLHALHPTENDEDIEHALDLMREATGKLISVEKKPGES